MQSKSVHSGGYSKKHQRLKLVSKSFDSPGFISAHKEKLPKIHKDRLSKQEKKFKQVLLTRPIEIRSKDYENAIKAHLGIQRLSKDSSFSSIFKKPNEKSPHSTEAKDTNTVETTRLPHISLESKRINRPKQLSNKKLAKSYSISDEKDKEIEVLQSSLNKINLLLNKLLHKPHK